MADEVYEELMTSIREDSDEDFEDMFQDPEILTFIMTRLRPEQKTNLIIEKNIRIFKGVNAYVQDFHKKTSAALAKMKEGVEKEEVKKGQHMIVEALLTREDLTPDSKVKLQALLGIFAAAAAAGGKRKMTRKYCKKTPCKKMGFTQRASCRPWKNCYKNKK